MDDEDVPISRKKRKNTCVLCGPTHEPVSRIPKYEPRRSEWVEFCKAASSIDRSSSLPKVDSIRLCILHFTADHISRNKYGTPVCLMPTAVPSVSTPKNTEVMASEESNTNMAMSIQNSLKRIMSRNEGKFN